MTHEQLNNITNWLIENVFRNTDIMYDDSIWNQHIEDHGSCFDLIDVIATLHNLLYEVVEGERYDYMFHWCNKIGTGCLDNVFDSIMDGGEDEKTDN